jgi:hypothetical protein
MAARKGRTQDLVYIRLTTHQAAAVLAAVRREAEASPRSTPARHDLELAEQIIDRAAACPVRVAFGKVQ